MTHPQQVSSLSNILRYNISSQLIGRLSTFLINIYLIRYVDGDTLGLINVRLNLLYMTIGFLSTEPLRKTCLSADLRIFEVSKYAWLSPIFGFCISSILYVIWSHLPVQGVFSAYDYQNLVFYFCLAAFLETLAEPLAILSLKQGDNKTFAIAQSILLVSNKFSVLLLLFCGLESKSALCLGQIIGSVIYTLIFYVKFIHLYVSNRLNYLPWPYLTFSYDQKHLKSIGALLFHSVQKQLITDGSAYIMTFTEQLSFTEQAVYDAIERLGSLVARIILRPLEESCAIYFSSQLERNNVGMSVNPKLLALFQTLCRLLVTLGLVVSVFAIPYSPLAVSIYGGKLLSENRGALLLTLYAFYLLVMAINGIVECFAFSTMNASSIMRHARFLFVTSIAHLITNVVFLKLMGAPGFILANILHSLLRIVYNWSDIKKLQGTQRLSFMNMIPDFTLITLLFMSLIITGLSGLIFAPTPGLIHTGAHIGVGGVMLLIILAYLHQNGELYQRLWEHLD